MKKVPQFSKFITSLISLATVIFLFTLPVTASDDIDIDLTVNECEVTAEAADNRCDANQCAGDSACVCAKKNQFLNWVIDTEDRYKIIFSGEDPLKANCGKNYGNNHKCKIKETVQVGQTYSYIIKLERCDDGSDPRIIIRN